MASEEPSPEEPLAPPDDMSDVPVVTSDAGDTENTVAMKERPGDPKDQTSSQGQSPSPEQASPPGQTAPQDQASSQEQADPQNQASSQEQSPPPDQASPPGQTPPQDQAFSQEQAIPPNQASSQGQLVPQNQASSQEQSPPPGQASSPEKTVPQNQASPQEQLSSPNQAFPQEQTAPHEQVSPPKQLASKNQAVPQEQTDAQELVGSPELIVSKESHPDILAQGADYPHEEELTRPSGPDQFMENPGEFSASLEGQGWVFRSDLSTPGGWRFLNRERRENASLFNFLFSEEGNWNLVFDRQDLADGGIERRVRKVHVGGGEAIDILEEQESISPEVMAENNVEQNEVNSQPAALSGQYLEALKRWETEAEDPTEVGVRAREAIVREAAKNGTTALLAAWLPRYLEDGADPEVLALSLKTLDDTDGYEDGVISILEELLRFESHGQGDEWLYRLASYLEKPGERRDLSRAVKLYQKLVESWPFSKWRESAEERLIWLNRHYFRLR